MSAWTWWLAATILLLIFELLSGTVAALCLSAGCLLGMLAALLGLPLIWQVIIAVAGTIIVFALAGPAIRRLYAKLDKNRKYATGMDALIGRVGTVTEEVTSRHEDKGRVKIDGDNWMAYTDSPEQPLRRGSQVIVESYESIVIKVKPYKGQ